MQVARGMAAFISAMALSLSSFAATVVPEQGIVLVNHGNGYANANGPTTVNPGDIIVVNPGGSAQLSYPDGCTVPVAIGSVVTVGAQSPCTTQGSMTPTQATTGPAPGDGTAPPEGDGTPPGGVTPDGTGIAETIIGVSVGGAVVGTLLVTQKDKPASP
jgi:hypothetical protein